MNHPPGLNPSFRDPILGGPYPIAWWLQRRPRAHDHTAIVVRTRKGQFTTEWPDKLWSRRRDRPTGASAWYEVDIADHSMSFTFEPLCQGGIFRFLVEGELVWKVTAPDEVVKRGLRDVPSALQRALGKPIAEISRGFDVADSDSAADKINRELGEPTKLRFGVAYEEFYANVRPHGNAAEAVQAEQLAVRVEREREEIRIAQRAGQRAQTEHDLAMRKMATEFTAGLFRGTEHAVDPVMLRLLVAHLTERPGDTGHVIDVLRTESRARLAVAVKALETMLASNQFEPWQLQPIRQALLDVLAGQQFTLREDPGLEPPDMQKALEGSEEPSVIEAGSRRQGGVAPTIPRTPNRYLDDDEDEDEEF